MSSTLALCPVLKPQYFDDDGNPLAGGMLFSYVAGTSIPLATYVDSTGDTPNTNPIVLDSAGRANVWLSAGSYKFILEDSLGDVLFTEDNVSVISNGSSIGGQTSFPLLDNQNTVQTVPGLVIDHTANQCVFAEYTIIRTDGTNYRREHGFLTLLYDAQNGWSMTRQSQGADSLNMGQSSLQISVAGQVQYKSDSMGGTYNGQMTWQINSAFPAEGI